MSIRIEINKSIVSSWKPVEKWCICKESLKIPLQPTLLNNCVMENNQMVALKAHRIVTSQYGFSFGTLRLKIKVGEYGIQGIGVCCRPGMIVVVIVVIP